MCLIIFAFIFSENYIIKKEKKRKRKKDTGTFTTLGLHPKFHPQSYMHYYNMDYVLSHLLFIFD